MAASSNDDSDCELMKEELMHARDAVEAYHL